LGRQLRDHGRPETPGELIAIVYFDLARSHMFGPPNDEAFEGHPLYSAGLRPYSVAEVRQSSWIRRLERMNAVHPAHRPEHFLKYRHYVLAFHDRTFECVAKGHRIETLRGSMGDAITRMSSTAD